MVRMPVDRPGLELIPVTDAHRADGSPALTMHVDQILDEWREEGEEPGVEAVVRFDVDGKSPPLRDVFAAFGETPLPPYMRREARGDDHGRYQTVYASDEKMGSVAAPTAGLHFTDSLLGALDASGVVTSRITLHVGAGTFKPVVAEKVAEHMMHSERFSVTVDELEAIAASAAAGHPIVPVGTTSARVLESVYWQGLAHHHVPIEAAGPREEGEMEMDLGHLDQWSSYDRERQSFAAQTPLADVFSSLARAVRACGGSAVGGSTSLCIAPGYSFRACDAIITNFHMPDSSLMMLVAAMTGSVEEVHTLYEHAIRERYRWASYGDASLLFNSAVADGGGTMAIGAAAALAEHVRASLPRRKVLLHSCCAPCSGAMVESMVNDGHDVTIFFYNPNIHPRKEYEIRKQENKKYAAHLGIDFVDLDGDVVGGIDVDEWYKRAKGMEFCPERGQRCSMCFDMRLERTALYAFEHGFDSFTTTNATSRWKDEAQVNESGLKAAAKYPGVEYWLSDWQGEDMTARKYRINAEQRFYKQEYCGCSYSLRDSNHWRAKQGQPPVQIGGDSFYSDPEIDEQEESLEVVSQFFEDSARFEEELKKTYAARRKDGASPDDVAKNNW